ncbi:MAG TPA: hypothetical protein VFT53_00975 [Candidatus Saccharimonadales bacterium]|nr:hypothetical protein [Candidatus Saccharimonadales bacterium]
MLANILPPEGYSPQGALEAVAAGCVVTGLSFMGAGLVSAIFTGGLSIPSAALDGCEKGAAAGAVYYLLTGDGGEGHDNSWVGDLREFFAERVSY